MDDASYQKELPGIALRIQTFAIHVPQNTNGFLAFSFTLKDGWLSSTSCLILEFDFKLGWSYSERKIVEFLINKMVNIESTCNKLP